MNRIRRTINQITDLAELVIKSMVLIFVVVMIAKEIIVLLIGKSLATYVSYILGIASLFVVVVSKKVRQEILSLGHK